MSASSQPSSSKTKIKILQISKFFKPYRGGIETVLGTLCAHLNNAYNLRVTVANTENKTIQEQVDHISIKRLASYGQIFSTSLCPSYFTELAKDTSDVQHLHSPNPIAELASLVSSRRSALVISHHSDILRPKFLRPIYHTILKRLYTRANQIVVSNPYVLQHSKILKPFRFKCEIIPYGIETSDYNTESKEQSLQIPHEKKIILFVGRLVYYKGIDVLLQAMQDIDAHLVIIGCGPLKKELKILAEFLDLKTKVSFIGDVTEEGLRTYYSNCYCLVLPSISKTEAFGMVQLEAMSHGKPVISTDLLTGVPWVNQHGITGLTVPPSNVEALHKAIQYLLDNPDQAMAMGQNGRERVETNFTAEIMAKNYVSVYQKSYRDFKQQRPFLKNNLPYRFFKRIFDIVLSGIGFVLAIPVGILFAASIWIEDRRPIFFIQERVGKGGRLFNLYKFRTMRFHGEEGIERQASEKDPRITRVGHFLRATAMDELPQLLNILKGDMSFVGPRALLPAEIEQSGQDKVTEVYKVPGYPVRILVHPGLTGIAQIYSLRNMPLHKKFRYDILYIKKQNLWLDLILVLKSFYITLTSSWGRNHRFVSER